jgi:hypothetical protein
LKKWNDSKDFTTNAICPFFVALKVFLVMEMDKIESRKSLTLNG